MRWSRKKLWTFKVVDGGNYEEFVEDVIVDGGSREALAAFSSWTEVAPNSVQSASMTCLRSFATEEEFEEWQLARERVRVL